MSRAASMPRTKLLIALAAVAVLSGCASANLEQSLSDTNTTTKSFTDGQLSLARDAKERDALRSRASDLLSRPLSQKDAVQLALVNSPALQAVVAQNWADSAAAAQSARIANPILTLERVRLGDETEIGRLLSFGLLDLLTLPSRIGVAERRIKQNQLKLSAEVIDQVTQVRQAWVRAVAAQQTLAYTQQVYASAQASAELAKRLQSVGNFNKLDRARQQAFYADTATQLASAQHQTTAAKEELVRLLGLDDSQAAMLKLPERLPALPKEPMSAQEAGRLASQGRLDLQIAKADYEAAARSQGWNTVTTFTDIELGVRRDSVFDAAEGTHQTRRGFEISLQLPIFDWGGVKRDAMNAQTLAAANRLEAAARSAGSNLRESYSAYRTAYDIARHHRDEVIPLRKTISEENQLRYNGMLISVFELLADSRDQVNSVMAALNAEQQFWQADAALQASLIGKPTSASVAGGGGGGTAEAAAGH
ncbi:TolC family protein [Acidovorax sp. PRC11]|nr:TolC family protein [Acidovorax sp. PRC11]MDT0136987.1 TolC family protein [Acidovorax sp. PRC11]